MRLYQRWETMDSEEDARNFVYRSMTNLARSHLRKHRRTRVGDTPDAVEPDPATYATDRMAVEHVLKRLSQRQRTCIVLVDFVGYDSNAVATMLRTSDTTVRVHLFRIRRAIREALNPTEE